MNIRKESMFVCAWLLEWLLVWLTPVCIAWQGWRAGQRTVHRRPPAHTQLNRQLYFDILCILYYSLKFTF